VVIADLGLSTIIAREFSQDRKEEKNFPYINQKGII
jgi:hypothetical protein